MLRAAGIKESYMVLTNPSFRVEKEVPGPGRFNHAIVAIKKDGEYIYLDPTAEGSVEYLTPYEDDKEVLVCTPEGEDLTKTPLRSPSINRFIQKTTATLTEDGTLRLRLKIQGKGIGDMGLRNIWRYWSEDKFKELMTQMVRSNYPKAKVDSIRHGDIDDFSKPMEIEIFITIPEYPLIVGDEWHLGGATGNLSFTGEDAFSLEERKYPIFFGYCMESLNEIVMEIPERFKKVIFPENFSFENDYIGCEMKYRREGNRIYQYFKLVFKKPQIPVDKYGETRELMKKLREHGSKVIILKEG
jgi:hypothetical protein